MDINRQQFNKYLNGSSRPSQRNLIRICEFFRINEAQLLVNHDEFISQYGQRPDFFFEQHFQSLFPTSSGDLKRYLGYYHSHYYSLGYPGKVIRALVCLYQYGGRTFSKGIERINIIGQTGNRNRYITKYQGLVAHSCNRLFIMEREMLWGKAFVMTILYPTYRSHITYLPGITMGCPTVGRIPSCTRSVYSFLGNDIDKKQALRDCGLFTKEENKINSEILNAIDNTKPDGVFPFQAVNPFT